MLQSFSDEARPKPMAKDSATKHGRSLAPPLKLRGTRMAKDSAEEIRLHQLGRTFEKDHADAGFFPELAGFGKA